MSGGLRYQPLTHRLVGSDYPDGFLVKPACIGMILSYEPTVGTLNLSQLCPWFQPERVERISDAHQ